MSIFRKTLSATSLMKDKVVNFDEENLGTIKEIMLDIDSGNIAYFVLSFGGFLGLGDKLFIIPFSFFGVDEVKKRVVLNVAKEKLAEAPGIQKAEWPDYPFTEEQLKEVYEYYGVKPYWEE